MMNASDFKFDKRVIERNLRAGLLSEDEVKRHLQTLEDHAEDAVVCDSVQLSMDKAIPTQYIDSEEEEL
jgi:hypothetical protein